MRAELSPTKIIKFLFTVLLLGLLYYYIDSQDVVGPPEPSRDISENTVDYHEIWRISSIGLWASRRQSAYISVTPEQLVAYADTDDRYLMAFSLSTGEVDWQIEFNGSVDSLVVYQDKVYVASSGYPLQAYNIQTGKLVWESVLLPERLPYFLDVQVGTLVNYSSGSVQTFNLETGELTGEDRWETPTLSEPIKWLGKFELHQTTGELFNVDLDTGAIVWRTPTDEDSGFPLMIPPQSGNKLILTYGRGFDSDIYAIDLSTGQRLWKADDFFVSNAAVAGGKVYALRKDRRLMILDEMTGTELGYIEFDGSEIDPGRSPYWVGANDKGQVFVYFIDSLELIALQIKF